ncbi:glycosyltransferase family 4 protein [Bdellovibrio bacteriovorus]|uniref:glycosyltransferase family 4 protein n=2 Tax=Bdellovibrio TaxID=958 RepID=UPI0035A7437B
MVAFETAEKLNSSEYRCVTFAPANSPLAQRLLKNGLPVIETSSRRKSSWANVQKLRSLIIEEKIESILVQHLGDLFLLRLAMWGFHSPRVIGFSHTFVGVSKRDFYHRWLYRLLNKLIALTPSHAQNLREHIAIDPEKIVVIPNSVDTEKFSPNKRSEKIRHEFDPSGKCCLIGLVGRLDKAKGQKLLIEAAALLKKDHEVFDFKIILVGAETLNEPGILKNLEAFTKELSLEKNVIFTGHREDVPDIMASLDVVVMASDAETFGRVIIEAMASGSAIVATDAGGVIDIVKHENTGLLFKPRDSRGLAKALYTLSTDTVIRNKLAKTGYEQALKTYSNHIVLKKLNALF